MSSSRRAGTVCNAGILPAPRHVMEYQSRQKKGTPVLGIAGHRLYFSEYLRYSYSIARLCGQTVVVTKIGIRRDVYDD